MGNFFIRLLFKNRKESVQQPVPGFFALELVDADQQRLNLGDLRSKHRAYLFVNFSVNSSMAKANFTKLQHIFAKYKPQGLLVVGLPCDQFRGRNPVSASAIAELLKEKYSVTFPIVQKVDVNGKLAAPLYVHLRSNSALKDKSTGKVRTVPWNFCKFLVDSSGTVVRYYQPFDNLEEIDRDVMGLLYC